mmetsp:Transcript_29147/g.41025  ORF Transcript_29147/g.41025 Transcript_29147/m.41025 type:complete len:213 (+) Transcript_29147:32-670(+)
MNQDEANFWYQKKDELLPSQEKTNYVVVNSGSQLIVLITVNIFVAGFATNGLSSHDDSVKILFGTAAALSIFSFLLCTSLLVTLNGVFETNSRYIGPSKFFLASFWISVLSTLVSVMLFGIGIFLGLDLPHEPGRWSSRGIFIFMICVGCLWSIIIISQGCHHANLPVDLEEASPASPSPSPPVSISPSPIIPTAVSSNSSSKSQGEENKHC